MTDRLARLLLECQGFAGKLEANHEMCVYWMHEMLAGHPKAQDFEPTGHGGSDPTALSGTRDDRASRDSKDYARNIERARQALVDALGIASRYQNGERPAPGDIDDVWCVMHLKHEVHNPRYRGELCRPCYERNKYQLENGMGDLMDEQVKHHANPTNNGRWPRQRIDPKSVHVARLERLQLGTAAMPIPSEAT